MTKSMYYHNPKQKMRVAMCLVYPESAPSDWVFRLRHWHVPSAISPLHDHDTYDTDKVIYHWKTNEHGDIILNKDGDPIPLTDKNGCIVYDLVHKQGDIKKPHYHVMIAYGNATTSKTFMRIIRDIGGVVPPWDHMEVCSVPTMYRYFGHLDDPDKYPYNLDDAILLGGFDPTNYETYMEKNAPFNDVLAVLKDHPEIHDYRSLAYYYKGRDNKLFYFVMNHTLALKGIFSSDNYSSKHSKEEKHIV